MKANSPKIVSTQESTHPKLSIFVKKHLEEEYSRELRERAQNLVENVIEASLPYKQFILDAGCGTGESSIYLAKNNPDALVLGIDKSLLRIAKAKSEIAPKNVIFFRENLIDFWLAANDKNLIADKTYLLYPNPWPKKKHVKRRWHGHPIFPHILRTSKNIILRSNWLIYVQEFSKAFNEFSEYNSVISNLSIEGCISNFEKKYFDSKHELYEAIFKV